MKTANREPDDIRQIRRTLLSKENHDGVVNSNQVISFK